MNNISIGCKVSLSKKLRALIGNEGSITLVVENIADGKGNGVLTLSSDKLSDQIGIGEETSIMITPIEIGYESPNSETLTHATIFSGKGSLRDNKVASKIAAVEAPSKGNEHKAIIKQVPPPKAFKEVDVPECKTWISNMTELIEETNRAKKKVSTIDPESAKNPRERAVLRELKEQEEAIDVSAIIVNDKVSSLSLNDLDISLKQNAPYDLKNISAKRIAASADLREMVKAGYIKFISPDEKEDYINKVDADPMRSELEVFSNHEDAEASIASGEVSSRTRAVIDERSVMEITDDSPTEDETMMVNLTNNLPKVRTRPPLSNGSRHTAHNTTNGDSPRNSGGTPAIKPIRKI